MKPIPLFAAALLGLATSFSAHAQTPVVGTPSAPLAPTSPILTTKSPRGATVVPGVKGQPADATTPLGASGERYQAKRMPTPRAVDVGGVAPTRPVGGVRRPGQPTRRLNKGRAGTTPVHP